MPPPQRSTRRRQDTWLCRGTSRTTPGSSRRWRFLVAAAGAAGIVAAVVGAPVNPGALAQDALELGRGDTVLQRGRPGYERRSIRSGGLIFQPSVSVSGRYSDNVFASQDDPEGDFSTVVRPRLNVRSDWSRHQLDGEFSVGIIRYAEFDSENEEDYRARLRGELDISERDNLVVGLTYRRQPESRTDPEFEGDDDRTPVNRINFATRYSHRFNRLGLSFTGSVQRRDFEAESESTRDRTSYRMAVNGAYFVSPNLNVFVRPVFRISDFDVEDDGRDRDSQTIGSLFGAAIDITGILTASLGAGLTYDTFEDPESDDFLAYTMDGTLEWNVTDLTSVIGFLRRSTQATSVEGASAKVVSEVNLAVQQELAHNFILLADGGFRREEFEGTDRRDDDIVFAVGGRYLVNRHFDLGMEYRLFDRDSTVENGNFVINRVSLTLNARF